MIITILLRHDADDFKGEMIAAHNRTKELKKNFPDADIKVLVLREYFNVIFCKIRKVKKISKRASFEYEGITYKALWFNFSPLDNILVKMHHRPITIFKKLNRFVKYLKDSDIIVAHSTYAGYLALQAKKKYGIPYTITWHGSDIHTVPNCNEFLKHLTTLVIENASANCFVSRDLLQKSESLTNNAQKYVLYNGVDREKFTSMSEYVVNTIREKYRIDSNIKHVAFIGNLYHVKNVLSLPEIYSRVNKLYKEKTIVYHFIGDGPLRKELENRCKAFGIMYRLWGNQPAKQMPSIINCMDLIVLPSINEGLPLISIETLACGVPMVGANVGGIPEAIGQDNVVNHGEDFASNMSKLICMKLKDRVHVTVGDQFSWEKTGQLEKKIIDNIVSR